MKTLLNYLLLMIFSIMLLVACKKEDEEPVPVQEKLPVAHAGDDATTTVGQKIELDGNKSNDPDGGTLTYLWSIKTKPEGSTATLVNADKIKAEFTPDVAGEFIFELTVNNSKKTAKDEVKLTASNAPYAGCTPIEAAISTNTTWVKRAPAGMVDYCIKANLTVTAALTIEPGVIIEFDDNTGLYVDGGKIIAKGNAENIIVFTGKNKTKGTWRGIELSASDEEENEFDYCEISYAGSTSHVSGVKAGLSLRNNSLVSLKNTVIKDNNGFGAALVQGSFINFANNTFTNNALAALSVKADMMGKLDSESKFTGGNGRDGIEVNGGTINEEAEQIWPAFNDGSKFYILNNFTINSGVKVQEGAILEFNTDKGIYIDGNNAYLNAVGTANKKIIFTGIQKEKGAWKGIEFSSTDNRKNEFVYCEINYAGSINHVGGKKAGISTRNRGEIKFRNSSVNYSNGYGIAMIFGSFVEFSNNSFSNNTNAAILLPADLLHTLDNTSQFNNGNGLNGVEVTTAAVNFTEEVTWPAFIDGSKYYIFGNITLISGLKIEPGALLHFAPESYLYVDNGGYLFARGTADKKITFTGIENGLTAWSWRGIEFSGTTSSKNELNHCIISYGGGSNHVSGFKANISLRNGAEVSIFNSTISDSGGWGIVKPYGNINTDIAQPNIFSGNTSGDLKE